MIRLSLQPWTTSCAGSRVAVIWILSSWGQTRRTHIYTAIRDQIIMKISSGPQIYLYEGVLFAQRIPKGPSLLFSIAKSMKSHKQPYNMRSRYFKAPTQAWKLFICLHPPLDAHEERHERVGGHSKLFEEWVEVCCHAVVSDWDTRSGRRKPERTTEKIIGQCSMYAKLRSKHVRWTKGRVHDQPQTQARTVEKKLREWAVQKSAHLQQFYNQVRNWSIA